MSEETPDPRPVAAERKKKPRQPWWKPAPPDVLAKGALTLAFASVGGWIFWYLQMPLAFMIGAMIFCSAAALSGVKIQTPGRLRFVMITVLGVMLGSGFTAESVAHFHRWIPSLITLIVFIIVVAGLITLVLHRYYRWDPVTSYFSAMPGGFAVMVILAEGFGGDDRRVSLVHAVRVMLTVMTIPFWFRLFEGYEPGGQGPTGGLVDIAYTDLGILLACAVLGFPIGRLLRLPSAALLGPTLVSAIVHYLGLTHATPPSEIVNIAQVVIGASVGCRFVGVSLLSVIGTVGIGVGSTIFLLLAATGTAYVLAATTGLPFDAILLAYAPGGLAEMTLISLAMGIDVAFVSIHHMLRIAFMMLTGPLVFRALQRWGVIERKT